MTWFFADYVLFSIAAIAGIVGLFIGFSGALALLAGAVVGTLAGKFSWVILQGYCSTRWSCGLLTLVIVLLVFGLVRWIVKKFVNGLLRQPADALFGAVLASLTGLVISGIGVYLLNFFQIIEIQSRLVSEALTFA